MTLFIAIDGNGGAGKTYLSNILAEKLDAPVYHLDEFDDDYHPFIGIPAMIETVRSLNEDIVIIEGIGVFDERFDFLQPYRIFVNTPTLVRATRAKNRDQPTDERPVEEWDKIYEIWESAATEYIEKASRRADLMVSDSDELVADYIIEKIKAS